MNTIGFGKASLKGTWKTALSFADDIEVNAVVLQREHGAPLAIVTSDMLSQWPSRCLAIRNAVARRLDTDTDNVGVFCTQNHGVPMDAPNVFDLTRLEDAFCRAAADALGAAVPAMMAYVETSPNPPGVVNRRVQFADAGRFTFFFGFEPRPDGRAGYAHLLNLAIRGLYAGPEQILRYPRPEAEAWPVAPTGIPALPSNPVFDDAEDPLIQGLFFKTPDGRPLGSISRWATHPITANAAGAKNHSADYPYYVRQYLSHEFGGGAVFLTGPCCNQAPVVHRKSLALARRTGEWVGRQLLDKLSSATWCPLNQVGAASEWIDLPIRPDYPRSMDAARKYLETARRQFLALRSRPEPNQFRKLKTLADEIERLKYATGKSHVAWCGLAVEDVVSGRIRHPLFALRANDAVIVGLPGEPFGVYSVNLRRRRPGVRLVVAEEGNGYLGYIPPAAEYPMGGYGSNSAIFGPDIETILLQGAESLIDRCLK